MFASPAKVLPTMGRAELVAVLSSMKKKDTEEALLSPDMLAKWPADADAGRLLRAQSTGTWEDVCEMLEEAGVSSASNEPTPLSLIGSDPLLREKGKEMQEFMESYAGRCAASTIPVSTQDGICDILWRISHGIKSNDEQTACEPVSPEFEKRMVTKKGQKRRMGILDWWQHEHGVKARVAACSAKNPTR